MPNARSIAVFYCYSSWVTTPQRLQFDIKHDFGNNYTKARNLSQRNHARGPCWQLKRIFSAYKSLGYRPARWHCACGNCTLGNVALTGQTVHTDYPLCMVKIINFGRNPVFSLCWLVQPEWIWVRSAWHVDVCTFWVRVRVSCCNICVCHFECWKRRLSFLNHILF